MALVLNVTSVTARVYGRVPFRRCRRRRRPRRRGVVCGVSGNGFSEIERALGSTPPDVGARRGRPLDGLSLSLPRDARLTQPHTAFKVLETTNGAVAACTVDVTFRVPYRVELGEQIAICGSGRELGNWDLRHGLQLIWTPGHLWTFQTRLPPGNYEYKVPVSQSSHNEMELTLEFGQTGISSCVSVLRETVVLTSSGEELFRMGGSTNIHTLNTLLNEPTPVPVREAENERGAVHDVQSYPIHQGRRDVNGFLQNELLLEDDDLKRLHRRCPGLKFKSVANELQPWLDFFLKDLGMERVHLAQLLVKRPSVLDLARSPQMQSLVDYFVKELTVNSDRFFRVLIRQPALLNKSLERDIEPRVRLLKGLTGLNDWQLGKILMGCSDVLTKSETEIRRRLQNLSTQLGLNAFQCANLLLRCPRLMAMKPESVTRKVAFLTKTLGRGKNELTAFPSSLSYSLENRIVKRFQRLDENGVPHQSCTLSAILKPKEERFGKIVERMKRDF